MNANKGLGSVWVLIGGIIIAVILAGLVMFVFYFLRPEPVSVAIQPQTVITLIPAMTLTPIIPTLPVTVTTPTPSPVPQGGIGIGVYVRISGTNGQGVNLRAKPGTSSAILLVGMDAEVFLVKDGPVQADSFTWWYLQAPYDKNRNGWAVENYLQPVQNP
jgi:hypothetical protein